MTAGMGTGRYEQLRSWLGIGLSGAALQLGVPWLDEIVEGLLPATPVDRPAFSGIRSATSGDDSERIRKAPITRARSTGVRSAVSLAKLPRLRRGDELRVSAELQVSTTCVERSRRCHGRRYRFDPTVAVRLVLAPGPGVTAPGRTQPVSRWRSTECSQRRPNRNHHCVLVVPLARKGVNRSRRLPCRPKRCHLNLLVSAHHPGARRGQVIVIGGDRPNGRIAQDKARLNAIVVRGDAQARVARATGRSRQARNLRLGRGRRVVYSARLDQPRRGERLEVRGRFVASLRRLRHNALLSAVLIAAPSPTATRPGPAAKAVSVRGRLSEVNGFNCTKGPSGFSDPCRVVKAGFAKVRRNPSAIPDLAGAPLYVNLVARAEPVLTRRKAPRPVRVRNGRVSVTRFGPAG